jgi:hypothetical protein
MIYDPHKTFYYWEPVHIYTPTVFVEQYNRLSIDGINIIHIDRRHNEKYYYSPEYTIRYNIRENDLSKIMELIDEYARFRGYVLLDKETSDKYRLLK